MTLEEIVDYYRLIGLPGVAFKREELTVTQLRSNFGNCICGHCNHVRLCPCGEGWVSDEQPPPPRDGARGLAVVVHNASQKHCLACRRPYWCRR